MRPPLYRAKPRASTPASDGGRKTTEQEGSKSSADLPQDHDSGTAGTSDHFLRRFFSGVLGLGSFCAYYSALVYLFCCCLPWDEVRAVVYPANSSAAQGRRMYPRAADLAFVILANALTSHLVCASRCLHHGAELWWARRTAELKWVMRYLPPGGTWKVYMLLLIALTAPETAALWGSPAVSGGGGAATADGGTTISVTLVLTLLTGGVLLLWQRWAQKDYSSLPIKGTRVVNLIWVAFVNGYIEEVVFRGFFQQKIFFHLVDSSGGHFNFSQSRMGRGGISSAVAAWVRGGYAWLLSMAAEVGGGESFAERKAFDMMYSFFNSTWRADHHSLFTPSDSRSMYHMAAAEVAAEDRLNSYSDAFNLITSSPFASRWGTANLLQALVFGALHYYGIPSGVVGVLLTSVYGWIMGSLGMYYGGIALPVALHTAADFVIFYGIV
eukprot:g10860.t1